MKNYKIYQTFRGERLYCTSHAAARAHIAKALSGTETAVWAGDEFAKPESLYRVGRGVYREYPDLEEGFWPFSEAEEILREFTEDVKLAYGTGKGDEVDDTLDDNWPDLAVTYQKAVSYFEKKGGNDETPS